MTIIGLLIQLTTITLIPTHILHTTVVTLMPPRMLIHGLITPTLQLQFPIRRPFTQAEQVAREVPAARAAQAEQAEQEAQAEQEEPVVQEEPEALAEQEVPAVQE